MLQFIQDIHILHIIKNSVIKHDVKEYEHY